MENCESGIQEHFRNDQNSEPKNEPESSSESEPESEPEEYNHDGRSQDNDKLEESERKNELLQRLVRRKRVTVAQKERVFYSHY